MLPISSIVELHYFSGGLKTILIGSPSRPDWLPDYDLVGLHNDVYLKDGEFVIEISRHKRKGNLITWIGVYAKGKDAIYGDRDNYLGIGLWLTNSLPLDAGSIINALFQICQQLVKFGPNDQIQSYCHKLLNEGFLQNWVRDINILLKVDDGILYDTTQHPETIYIRSTNQNLDASITKISDSILLNCINAEPDIQGASRVLYLLLNPSSNIENDKQVKQLYIDATPVKSLLEYFSNSIGDIKRLNLKLEDRNKTLATVDSSKSIEIEGLKKNNEILRKLHEETDSELKKLKQNQKTPGSLLEELKISVENISVSVSDNDKEKLLRLINAIDRGRTIRTDNVLTVANNTIFTKENYNDLSSKLNEIYRDIQNLKKVSARDQADRTQSNITSNNQSEYQVFGFSLRSVIYVALASLLIGGIFYYLISKDENPPILQEISVIKKKLESQQEKLDIITGELKDVPSKVMDEWGKKPNKRSVPPSE